MVKMRIVALVGSALLAVGCSGGPTSVTTTVGPESTAVPATDSGTQPPTDATDAETTTSAATQIANPASVFCVQQGGTLEIVDGPDGQIGYCNLPDGTRIEEWEYYRAENPDAPEIVSELPGDGVE